MTQTDTANISMQSPEKQTRGQKAALNLIRFFGLPAILATLFVIFSVVTDSFLVADNLAGLIQTASISALLFLGLTWVFTIGIMDVSFVAIAALANMIVAGIVVAGGGWPLAVILALAASVFFGVLNGFIIGALGLPSLITTIATGGIATALAAAIGLGSSVGIPEPSFLQFLFDVKVGIASLLVIFVLALILLCWFAQEKLTLGHYIFAMATNPRAALEAGIPVAKITILLCAFSALCSGAAGILIAVELSSGQPSIARSLFLDGLTAVFLGGTMIRLGKPNIIGTVVGVLIIAVLVRGGALLGWSDAVFQALKGGLLLLGVALVVWVNTDKSQRD